jgi:hypothetical protein
LPVFPYQLGNFCECKILTSQVFSHFFVILVSVAVLTMEFLLRTRLTIREQHIS